MTNEPNRFYWGDLIDTYSSLDLTFQSDKLNAIAGMAARAAACWSTTYIAGLWKEELPTCLLWRTTWIANTGKPAPERIARIPSWSWASVNDRVMSYRSSMFTSTYDGGPELLSVSNALCTYGAEGAYGTPLDGEIYVKGQLARFLLAEDNSIVMDTDDWTSRLKRRCQLALDGEQIKGGHQGQRYYFLLIVAAFEGRLLCLVLLPDNDGIDCNNSGRRFQRVGVFECRRDVRRNDRFIGPQLSDPHVKDTLSDVLESKFKETELVLV
ncbi:hypothetical protein IFR05_008167 [Cadophora sp. M221]|nr:hypothetical protein IFR05_008167 [Cadophora sp. M221]